MLNHIYRLIKPGIFEYSCSDIAVNTDKAIVRPIYLSICHADQRYYRGERSEEVLKKKLPMALIHEAIGRVVNDPTGTFEKDDLVVMIPNTPVETDNVIAENYLRSSKFRASGYDGFMQEYVEIDAGRLVKMPEDIDLEVAAFTELLTVSVHAITRMDRFAHSRRNTIGVWGDGNLGYITAVLFKAMFPDIKLYVFGIDDEKLKSFDFADEVFKTDAIPEDLRVDHAFECVGNEYSGDAINQIIDYINPEGTISILGVSENQVPINTRMVLEKGLRIFGSSRSGYDDFVKTINLYQTNPELIERLKKIVGEVITVRDIEDAKEAFAKDSTRGFGKTIMKWEI